MDRFHYIHSCDLHEPIRVKICTLEGSLKRLGYQDLLDDPILKFSGRNKSKFPDLQVEVVITSGSDGKALHVPVFTLYKHFSLRWEWNEWVKLPLCYSDLPDDAQLCLTLYDCDGPQRRHVVGGTTISLFGRTSKTFRQGQIDLRIWSQVCADGKRDTSTPGKSKNPKDKKENLQRLSKLSKQYRSRKITPVDWLDRLTFAEVEQISQAEKQSSNLLFLMIQFPEINFKDAVREVDVPHSIVYFEENGKIINQQNGKFDIIRCPDFDILSENIVEAKHYKLARSQRVGQLDKDLKPNAETRNMLNEIISYPITQQLSSEEQDHIWRFRYYLSSNKDALAKFVKCINWKVKNEASQALELLYKWAPMDPEDALELLGPSFQHPMIRKYAVNRLKQASDADIQLYFLQLVQALKYEKVNEAWLHTDVDDDVQQQSSLLEESSIAPNVMTVETAKSSTSDDGQLDVAEEAITSLGDGGLAAFLIDRACKNPVIANYFFWYVTIECEDVSSENRSHEMYKKVLRKFRSTLKRGPLEWKDIDHMLDRQEQFITKLVQLISKAHKESGNRQKKIERLQALLCDSEEFKFNFANFEPLLFPLEPTIKVCGIIPESATLFKSSLMPARLTFRTEGGGHYTALFKLGDDLRQDQLVLQMISLMDKIFQEENLDLRLSPYAVLATSTKHGFVQFVESVPIADILSSDGSIQNYLKKHNFSETAPYQIQSDVMSNYVKSCAGYCVITFILGVGDRHLDNLLISKSGKLFHIDFGYILGRDPKVMPPPMKLSREMIEAFGGMNSEHFMEFKKECYTAFLSLRRYSNLILNLFSLMVEASVPDIALEPDKTVKKVQDKFRLDLNDEEAVRFIQTVIDVSAMAVIPGIVDRVHKLAQLMRN